MDHPSKADSPIFWPRRLLYGVTNWALFLAGMLNLAIGTRSAIQGQVAIAATSLTAGLALLFAATIDRFESLKGLGVEAKTRKLDQKIEQADEALRRLREVAELMSGALMDLNCKVGRFDSAPAPRDSYGLARKVHSLLSALGTGDSQIRATLEPWARIMCHDLAAAALVKPLWDAFQQARDKLRGGSEPIKQYHDRLARINDIPLDRYPEEILRLYDDVPLEDASSIAPARRRAEEFAADMVELRRTFALPHPERWFEVIDRHRQPKLGD